MSTLRASSNYTFFELHKFNRDVFNNAGYKALKKSMEKHGWIDAYPMHVVRGNNKKLKIKAGHHRFLVAQELGIPVKFVVCDQNDISIHELEKATTRWGLKDYLISYIKLGYHSYLVVKSYCDRTGIGLNNAISLLGGQSAGSGNFTELFKSGTYQLGDSTHSGMVADIVLHCKKCKIPFTTNQYFVAAISKISWVKEFDPSILKHKISTFPYLLEKQPNLHTYVDMLDTVYNRQNKSKIPLSFLSNEAAKKRLEKGLKRKKLILLLNHN